VQSLQNRIKELRKALNLSQQEFADRLNIKRGAVANYEIGRNAPIDAVISLICREFSVNEFWLRTGEGEMFRQKTRAQEIADFAASLYDNPTSFQAKLVTVLAKLEPEQWVLLEEKAMELFEEMQKEKAGK
jgi:transcriptional regulator with XRE-family HTH domain